MFVYVEGVERFLTRIPTGLAQNKSNSIAQSSPAVLSFPLDFYLMCVSMMADIVPMQPFARSSFR